MFPDLRMAVCGVIAKVLRVFTIHTSERVVGTVPFATISSKKARGISNGKAERHF